MPQSLLLHDFGSLIWGVFGCPPYHVGSSVEKKEGWRDVDVRVILEDADYEAWGLGKPRDEHNNEKWRGLVLAFSVLGKQMTGLPIDFQIQQQTYANKEFSGRTHIRSALGIIPLRLKGPEK